MVKDTLEFGLSDCISLSKIGNCLVWLYTKNQYHNTKSIIKFPSKIVPGAKCQLDAPSLTLQTGCTEPQLVAYLECEAAMDRFRPRPIAIIGNQSRWDEYCTVAAGQFRPCVEVGSGEGLALFSIKSF
jgi:hypothetical protein